tara:strand:+ start:4842 stop:5465 length:624 start_codon:yes stop_codon:yes gene_type:complete
MGERASYSHTRKEAVKFISSSRHFKHLKKMPIEAINTILMRYHRNNDLKKLSRIERHNFIRSKDTRYYSSRSESWVKSRHYDLSDILRSVALYYGVSCAVCGKNVSGGGCLRDEIVLDKNTCRFKTRSYHDPHMWRLFGGFWEPHFYSVNAPHDPLCQDCGRYYYSFCKDAEFAAEVPNKHLPGDFLATSFLTHLLNIATDKKSYVQ